jgi:hypothetical protein
VQRKPRKQRQKRSAADAATLVTAVQVRSREMERPTPSNHPRCAQWCRNSVEHHTVLRYTALWLAGRVDAPGAAVFFLKRYETI